MARGPRVTIQCVNATEAMQAYERLLRERVEVLRKEVDDARVANRNRETNATILDLKLGRRKVDDLPPELAAELNEALDNRMKAVADLISLLSSEATVAPAAAAVAGEDPAMGQDGEPM
ncbi:hypothetical protein ACP70R_040939 [Stipagrostis hirtigluma subsp. patula]